MSRGSSGRIVVEINPTTKDELYITLAKNKLTLKEWFLNHCITYINEYDQPKLFSEEVAERASPYLKE